MKLYFGQKIYLEYNFKTYGYRYKNRECKKCGRLGYFKIGCKNGKVIFISSNNANKIDEIVLIYTIVSNCNTKWKKIICMNNFYVRL